MYKLLPILGFAIVLGMNLCIAYANRLYGFGNGWSNLGMAIICTVAVMVIGPISAVIAYNQKRFSIFVITVFLSVAYPINQDYYYCIHMKMAPGAMILVMMTPFYLLIVSLITAAVSKIKMA
jgi:hypothetical protein